MCNRWGNWIYRPSTHTLEYRDGPRRYEIDLESCTQSSEVLDWVAQITQKRWSSSKDIGDFVQALNELLALQKNYCPGGEPRTADPRVILARRT